MTVLEIVLSGSLTTVVPVAGYFIGRAYNSQDKKNELFFQMFDKMNNTLNNLNTTLSVMQEHNNNFEKNCAKRHEHIDKALEKIRK